MNVVPEVLWLDRDFWLLTDTDPTVLERILP